MLNRSVVVRLCASHSQSPASRSLSLASRERSVPRKPNARATSSVMFLAEVQWTPPTFARGIRLTHPYELSMVFYSHQHDDLPPTFCQGQRAIKPASAVGCGRSVGGICVDRGRSEF
jgi:hypothetical protein